MGQNARTVKKRALKSICFFCMSENTPSLPRLDQHLAMAGMQGSGKTTGAIDMLSRRLQIPWLVIDHKKDSGLAKLPLRRIALNPLTLPREPGMYHIAPDRH